MLDFAKIIDLPLIWAALIATAVFLYVLLDGFDLGCGILFPFAPSESCRNKIMNSIAPFWDGNETWLVLGGGGLFAAFPLAYAVIMPAVYMPVILMLLGLIFRGVAFEFRFKADESHKKIWDICFHIGSTLAAFMQGIILGTLVQGIEVAGRNYAGSPLAWANGFSIICGIALVFGYALLGATWLVMKTNGDTAKFARKSANYSTIYVIIAMAIISISVPLMDARIAKIWFSLPNFYYLLIVPILTMLSFIALWHSLHHKGEVKPFLLTIFIFFLGYIGLAISLYPWLVPYKFTIWQAAAASTSQSLLLVGTVIFLPLILIYTGYSYYIFRGKTHDKAMY